MQLSEKILALRKSRGMSQEDLASALEVTRQTVSRWEGGSALPDAENLLQLSLLFGVSADYLLRDSETEPAAVSQPRPVTAPDAEPVTLPGAASQEHPADESDLTANKRPGLIWDVLAGISALIGVALCGLAWYVMDVRPALASIGFGLVAIGFLVRGENEKKQAR